MNEYYVKNNVGGAQQRIVAWDMEMMAMMIMISQLC